MNQSLKLQTTDNLLQDEPLYLTLTRKLGQNYLKDSAQWHNSKECPILNKYCFTVIMWTERYGNQETSEYENDWYENQITNFADDSK